MEFGRRVVLAVVVLAAVVAASFLIDTAVSQAYARRVVQLTLSCKPQPSIATISGTARSPGGPMPHRSRSVRVTSLRELVPRLRRPGCGARRRNPALARTGSVRVDYRFTDLAGTASLGAYGLHVGDGRAWTNRQSGYGTSGYYVSGTAAPGDSPRWATPLPEGDRYVVEVAGSPRPVDEDAARNTRTLWFERINSGLDGLHITRSRGRKGQVTETTDLDGRSTSRIPAATGSGASSDGAVDGRSRKTSGSRRINVRGG
jgi:hypothetical protein